MDQSARRRRCESWFRHSLLASGRCACAAACCLLAASVSFAVPVPGTRVEPDVPYPHSRPVPVPQGAAPVPDSVEPSVADRAPYNRWTTHAGAAAEAVVHVRVHVKDYLTGETQVREGSGFVIRCDGFVLVPSRLLTPMMRLSTGEVRRANLKDKVNVLTFAAADGDVPAPQRVQHPRFFYEKQEYAVVKVNDFHLKGLPLLAPRNVKEGMTVQVVFARPRADRPDLAEAVTVPAIVGAKRADEKGFAFAGEPPRVAPGAVVVDAASGMALGIVAGGDPASAEPAPAGGFTTFADFHAVSNAVALAPDARARESQPGGGAAERDGMVWVPGGAVALQGAAAADYAALYGKWVACTPGFWIDRREVTNAEYRQFLQETGHRPLPDGWSEDEVAGPRRSPGLPVTGVRPADAAAYAAWRGKRLVTPVEWARASRGAGGRWLAEYRAALAEAEVALRQALAVFARAEAQQAMLTIAEMRSRGIKVSPGATVHNSELQRIAEERRLFIAQLVETFNRRFAFPLLVAPAGEREQDQSVYGVRDTAMNVPELLLPNAAHRPVEVAPKLLAPRFDPDRVPRWAEEVLAEVNRRAGLPPPGPQVILPGDSVTTTGPTVLSRAAVRGSRALGEAAGRRLAGSLLPFPAADPALDKGAAEAAAMTGAGFRCAR